MSAVQLGHPRLMNGIKLENPSLESEPERTRR